METHGSTLAWKIPWTEEPGGLQSMESQRVRRNSAQHSSLDSAGWLLPARRCRLGWIPGLGLASALLAGCLLWGMG